MTRYVSVFLLSMVTLSAIAQTGGGFNLEQNVIGNGGWRSDGGSFMLLGTMGQGNAGSTAAGGGFHLIDGLWAIEDRTASSPFAVVSGHVTLANGVGLPRVRVTATNPTTSATYEIFTRAQGIYDLSGIPTGSNYVLTVSHRGFEFEPSSVSLFTSGNRAGVDFVAAR